MPSTSFFSACAKGPCMLESGIDARLAVFGKLDVRWYGTCEAYCSHKPSCEGLEVTRQVVSEY